jgi:protein-S-isoprenylcysteine O-methyltransferase Ste14
MARIHLHAEHHLVNRIGWLRAAVLGANDGILSTASLIVGVAAAAATKNAVLVAGVAGLVAGAMSMATGEYVSVSWAIVLFRREGTEVEPTSPTNRKLITSGPYQFTRNPMYLGLVILTLGIAIWVGAWPMFGAPIALFATANWVHIPFEEAKMRRQFGAAYENYVARVRRWI